MNFDEEMVAQFGALGYDVQTMSLILNWGIDSVDTAMAGDFGRIYKQGAAMAQFAIDAKLFDLAKTGDIKAIEKLDLRRRQRNQK